MKYLKSIMQISIIFLAIMFFIYGHIKRLEIESLERIISERDRKLEILEDFSKAMFQNYDNKIESLKYEIFKIQYDLVHQAK